MVSGIGAGIVGTALIACGAAIVWWGLHRHQRWYRQYVEDNGRPPILGHTSPHASAAPLGGIPIALGLLALIEAGMSPVLLGGVLGGAAIVIGLILARGARHTADRHHLTPSPFHRLTRVRLGGYLMAAIGLVVVAAAIASGLQ